MFSKSFQKQFTFHLHFQVRTTIPNIPKFPSIMENRHATEPLCPKKYTGEDSPQPSEYGLMHVFGLSSQTSIEDEENIAMGQEHLDLASADISFEANQNAEPFFVTEVIFLYLNLHSKTCMICMLENFFVLFYFPD